MNYIATLEKMNTNIKVLAKQKGLYIGDIERKARMSVGTLSGITKAKHNITLDKVLIICEVLEVGIDELLSADMREQELEQRISELQKELDELRGTAPEEGETEDDN